MGVSYCGCQQAVDQQLAGSEIQVSLHQGSCASPLAAKTLQGSSPVDPE